jgi:carboxyl-terminal processing protease
MLRALGDRWSTYYGTSEFTSFQAALEGHYSGVGLWLRGSTAGSGAGVEVGSVQPGSPAERAGVLAGDVLLSVAGKDVTTADVPTVAGLLRGAESSTVRVAVRRGAATRTVSLTRTTFSTADVAVERLAGNIARIAVTGFTRGVGRDVARAMEDAPSGRPAGGVVLDLRDNPGGLLDEAVAVASVFLDGGPVVSYERRGRSPQTLEAFAGGDVATPLVVLVNPSTASAAEVVTGALQEPSTLSDGSALELTVGRYLTPAGRSLDGIGVEPDVVVPPGEAPEVAEQRAIDVLTGLVAALGGTGHG